MASVSATSLCFEPSLKLSIRASQGTSSFGRACVGWSSRGNGFPSLRSSSRFHIYAAAKGETVDKVCEIVRQQLALPPESQVTGETTFNDLGADSLDTVEIVMALEEHFDIGVDQESSEAITTVQDAADLIEKLVQNKASAAGGESK